MWKFQKIFLIWRQCFPYIIYSYCIRNMYIILAYISLLYPKSWETFFARYYSSLLMFFSLRTSCLTSASSSFWYFLTILPRIAFLFYFFFSFSNSMSCWGPKSWGWWSSCFFWASAGGVPASSMTTLTPCRLSWINCKSPFLL